jgi:hypothetical protein
MVTTKDIEDKARQIEAALVQTKESVQDTAVLAGVAVIVVVAFAFFFGRRKGRGGKTIVEVYRVK